MRYQLRTLLILLAIGPPMLAGVWSQWDAWRIAQARAERLRAIEPSGDGPLYVVGPRVQLFTGNENLVDELPNQE